MFPAAFPPQTRNLLSMQGNYSTSIGADILDEAPFAYRGLEEIKAAVEDTLTIDEVLKPVFNFKVGGVE